jgi:hypothetical protein
MVDGEVPDVVDIIINAEPYLFEPPARVVPVPDEPTSDGEGSDNGDGENRTANTLWCVLLSYFIVYASNNLFLYHVSFVFVSL